MKTPVLFLTMCALIGGIYAPLSYGHPGRSDSNARVVRCRVCFLGAEVQAALARRGYYRGKVDNLIGTESIRALRAFQQAQELPLSGRIDRKTLDALELR